jgi:hypothetical protein
MLAGMTEFRDETVHKRTADDGSVYYVHATHRPPSRMTESTPQPLPPTKGKDRKRYGPGPRETVHYFCRECSVSFFIERASR